MSTLFIRLTMFRCAKWVNVTVDVSDKRNKKTSDGASFTDRTSSKCRFFHDFWGCGVGGSRYCSNSSCRNQLLETTDSNKLAPAAGFEFLLLFQSLKSVWLLYLFLFYIGNFLIYIFITWIGMIKMEISNTYVFFFRSSFHLYSYYYVKSISIKLKNRYS